MTNEWPTSSGSNPPALHERLLLAMKRSALTQAELARRLHTNPRVLRRYLSGERTPPSEFLSLWERECGLSPGDLTSSRVADQTDAVNGKGDMKSSSVADGAELDRPPGTAAEKRTRFLHARFLVSVLFAVAVVAAIVWLAERGRSSGQAPLRPDAVACPSLSAGTTFRGLTYEKGVVVRDGAGQDFPIDLRLPGNCLVGFSGYCVGQPIDDVFEGTLDSRWFIIRAANSLDRHLVSSAVIEGDPPAGSPPVSCPGSRAVPETIDLSAPAPAAGRQPTLLAVAAGADIVGFAAFLPVSGASGAPRWQQVAFVQGATDAFAIELNPLGGTFVLSPGDVTVAAVVCLAAGAPTMTQALVVLESRPGMAPAVVANATPTDPGVGGRSVACRYPDNPPSSVSTVP
jgi:transcriptional regulator with XRE-family HTH domain